MFHTLKNVTHALDVLYTHTHTHIYIYIYIYIYLFIYLYLVWCKAGGHKFSKNLGTTLEFWVTWNKFCTENPQMLGTTVYNLYGQVTCHPVFVPSWCQKYSHRVEPTYIRINQVEIYHNGVLLTLSQKH